MSEIFLTNVTKIKPKNERKNDVKDVQRKEKQIVTKEEAMRRHQSSDKRYRQNMNKGFAALKTIVKQNRKQISGQVKTGVHIKTEPTIRKKAEKMSRIDVMKQTIDLIGSKEHQIDNIFNERQQKLIQSSVGRVTPVNNGQIMASNGLQKIKDVFSVFEKRYELELKETKPKKKEENIITMTEVKKEIIDSNNCLELPVTPLKTFDPLISELNIKKEVQKELFFGIQETPMKVNNETKITNWITGIVDLKTVVGEITPLKISPNKYQSLHCLVEDNDQSVCIKNEDRESPAIEIVEWDASVALNREYNKIHAIDSEPITTDLSEHLAANIPNSPFGFVSQYLFYSNSYH